MQKQWKQNTKNYEKKPAQIIEKILTHGDKQMSLLLQNRACEGSVHQLQLKQSKKPKIQNTAHAVSHNYKYIFPVFYGRVWQ